MEQAKSTLWNKIQECIRTYYTEKLAYYCSTRSLGTNHSSSLTAAALHLQTRPVMVTCNIDHVCIEKHK